MYSMHACVIKYSRQKKKKKKNALIQCPNESTIVNVRSTANTLFLLH